MRRDWLFKLAAAVLIGWGTLWVVQNTEWVDTEVSGEVQGEARTNPLYAVQQLGRRLGGTMVVAGNLDTLPPPGATLWLDSWHWDLFDGRAPQLRRWVESGGHLVIGAGQLGNEHLQSWIPVEEEEPPRQTEDTEDPDAPEHAASVPEAGANAPTDEGPHCRHLRDLDGTPRAYPERASFKHCSYIHGLLRAQRPAVWGLTDEVGPRVLRLRVGQGLVTVTQFDDWSNAQLFEQDNALVAAAILGFKPGARVWWVTQEARTPLLTLVWERAWVVLALGALALMAAVWRGTVRFGPPMPEADLARRSMAEQVRGTAGFLQAHGRETLVRAQIRALDDTARLHVRDYERLDPLARAQALAQASGLDVGDVTRALQTSWRRSTGDFLWTLETLETLRRRLRQQAGARHGRSDQQG